MQSQDLLHPSNATASSSTNPLYTPHCMTIFVSSTVNNNNNEAIARFTHAKGRTVAYFPLHFIELLDNTMCILTDNSISDIICGLHVG